MLPTPSFPTVTSCVRSAWTRDLSLTGPSPRHVSSLLLAAVSLLLLAFSAVLKNLGVFTCCVLSVIMLAFHPYVNKFHCYSMKRDNYEWQQ